MKSSYCFVSIEFYSDGSGSLNTSYWSESVIKRDFSNSKELNSIIKAMLFEVDRVEKER